MLDQSEKDSELRSVRHLTHEDLEAYATGRLAVARLSSCQAHLDSCEACRAELEDLRAFKGELASFARPERKRRRKLPAHVAAPAAIICIAAASTVFLLWYHKPRIENAAVAMPVGQAPRDRVPVSASLAAQQLAAEPPVAQASIPQAPVALTAANTQANNTRIAAIPNQQAAIRSVAMDARRAPGSPAPAAPEANKGFALLGPTGKTISETRPEFSWEPLPGAIRYSVAIVDARLHPVQRSPALRTTVWRPRRPLRRGRTYLWQVTATLRGGSKVVASTPGTLTESTAEELSKASPGDADPVAPRTAAGPNYFERVVKSDNR